jgi:hypothetical protein
MNSQMILEELLNLLESKGIKIRYDTLGGRGGGLCKLKEGDIFFVDTDMRTLDMAAVCAETVSKVIDIEKIYLKPEIREFIEENS